MVEYPPILCVIEDLVGHKLEILPNSEPDSASWLKDDTYNQAPGHIEEPTISGMICPLKKHVDPCPALWGGFDWVWRIYLESNLFYCDACDDEDESDDIFVLNPFDLYKFIKGKDSQSTNDVIKYFNETWSRSQSEDGLTIKWGRKKETRYE